MGLDVHFVKHEEQYVLLNKEDYPQFPLPVKTEIDGVDNHLRGALYDRFFRGALGFTLYRIYREPFEVYAISRKLDEFIESHNVPITAPAKDDPCYKEWYVACETVHWLARMFHAHRLAKHGMMASW